MSAGRWLRLGSILVLIALLLLTFTPVHMQQPDYQETFTNPDLSNWELVRARVEDGRLIIEPEGLAAFQRHWDNFSLSLRVRRTGPGYFEFAYRATDKSAYRLVLTGDYISLNRDNAQGAVELEARPVPFPSGVWSKVELDITGGEHRLRIDDQDIFNASDPEPLPPGGIILFSHAGSLVELDEIYVRSASMASTIPDHELTDLAAYQVTESWVQLGGPPGGLGYDIRMVPDNPDIMYVTDGFAGEFKSINGGQDWFPINAGMEFIAGNGVPVFSTTVDPHDSKTIWVGQQLTGRIYRSLDGGDTWEERDTGLIKEDCLRSVRGITVDPNDPQVVYAGLEVGSSCWARQTIIKRFELVGGEIYKSTNAGATWRRIWEGDNLARYILVDPRNSNRIYVSTGLFDREAKNSDPENGFLGGVGILRSDDGGQTWTVLDENNGLGGLFIPSLWIHPTDPDTLIASVTYPAKEGGEGVYVSSNGGDSWQKVLSVRKDSGMDAVEVSTLNPNVWYASHENEIFRSDDSGKTWVSYYMGTAERGGGVSIDLQVDPRDPFRIFQNAYGGGNMLSIDGGATWSDASRGYSGARIDSLAVVGSGWTVFANQYRSDDGGLTWRGIDIPGKQSKFFRASSQSGEGVLLQSTGPYGQFAYTHDEGASWQTVQVAETNGHPLNSILVAAPSAPQTLYLGYFSSVCALTSLGGDIEQCFQPSMPGLFHSIDGGKNWEKLTAPFGEVSTRSLAVHPQEAGHVYAATALGLYRSRNSGQSWKKLSGLDDLAIQQGQSNPDFTSHAKQYIIAHAVAIDPFDPQVVYAAVEPGAVMRSSDGGDTWEPAAAGMDPNEYIVYLLCDPQRPGVIYAASRVSGLFYSVNSGDNWQKLNQGLPRLDLNVLALSEDGRVLYAGAASGSGGAGVLRLGSPAGDPPTPAAQPATLDPIPLVEEPVQAAELAQPPAPVADVPPPAGESPPVAPAQKPACPLSLATALMVGALAVLRRLNR
jgi:photosystem II stability/assembly factor-like uncharacterized protein